MQSDSDNVSFHELAKQAKKRMKNGYWENENRPSMETNRLKIS